MLTRPAPARREPPDPIEDFVVPLERNPWWLWDLPADPPPTVPSSDDGER